MSITDLLEQNKKLDSKIIGVVSGIVTNNQDPEKMGRVKVKIPRISGDEESNWARIAAFMAGNDRGSFYLPEVDDEVLVAFEYGDINMPYIIGSLWNGKDKPPEQNTDGKNNIRIIKSRSGHIIKLDDTENSEKIEIKSRSGHIIRLDDKNNNEKIEIVDKTEKNMIVIEKNNNKISIKSDKDIELSAPNGKVIINAKDIEVSSTASTKIQANSKIEAKATGNMELGGAKMEIKATGNMELGGALMDIKANGNMNLNANGIMNVKGSLLNLN